MTFDAKEAIVFCPHCSREWTYYYENESELPDDRMVVCSSCEADRSQSAT